MAEKRKITRSRAKTQVKTRAQSRKSSVLNLRERLGNGITDYFRFGESYTSLILGVIVVVITSILLLSIVRSKHTQPVQETSSTKTEKTVITNPTPNQKTYTVKSGDSLWTIAVSEYNNGYKWTEIAKANNLTSPGIIYSGNKLIIPKISETAYTNAKVTPTPTPKPQIKSSPVTSQQSKIQSGSKITGSTYTVQRGDFLWEIAIRAYGDGYKWTEIAKANNLTNPDLIFSNNVLKLPR